MNSDVPISIALSGGLDSTSVLLGSRIDSSHKPVCLTYINSNSSLSSEDKQFFKNYTSNSDEANCAKQLAAKYHLPHISVFDNGLFLDNLKECISALECGHTSTSIVPA